MLTQSRGRGAGARIAWLLGLATLLMGSVVWAVLMVPHAFAQEPSQESSPAPSAPAPVDEVTSSPQPQETRQKPSSPPPAEERTHENVLSDISGLVMQPVFLAIRIPVAVMGGVVGGVLWPFGGESHDSAHQVWTATVGPPWGWPDFVQSLGRQSQPPQ
jgi:hypothetical protein